MQMQRADQVRGMRLDATRASSCDGTCEEDRDRSALRGLGYVPVRVIRADLERAGQSGSRGL